MVGKNCHCCCCVDDEARFDVGGWVCQTEMPMVEGRTMVEKEPSWAHEEAEEGRRKNS